VNHYGASFINTTPYPVLTFGLVIVCGNPSVCAQNDGVRFKLMESEPSQRDVAWYESSLCRTSIQSPLYLTPTNCESSASCSAKRTDSPFVNPTWKNMKVDAKIENNIIVNADYDVCYCDGNCLVNANWFRVGTIRVNRMKVTFTVSGSGVKPYTDLPGSINIQGYATYGTSLPGTWATTGSQTREMKILKDDLYLANKKYCLETVQSSLIVSGHTCQNTLDCDQPNVSSNMMQTYGSDKLSILRSGWIAVCYCDRECNQMNNWAVAGRLLVSGPRGSDTWVFPEKVSFSMIVHGWGLDNENSLRILGPSDRCGDNINQHPYVSGPQAKPTLLQVEGGIKFIGAATGNTPGTHIKFRNPSLSGNIYTKHGLVDGDWIIQWYKD